MMSVKIVLSNYAMDQQPEFCDPRQSFVQQYIIQLRDISCLVCGWSMNPVQAMSKKTWRAIFTAGLAGSVALCTDTYIDYCTK